MPVNRDDVLNALRQIIDPDLHRDIVSLGFVQDLAIDGPRVSFRIVLTTPACPVKGEMERLAREFVGALPGVETVEVTMDARTTHAAVQSADFLPGVKNSIAVSSGKGGVGKSTVSVNLAVALARTGAEVGLLDADIYGPNIPIMLGAQGEQLYADENKKIIPLEKYGVRFVSMGYFVNPDEPLVWRGPMLHSAIRQLLADVKWGALDYFIIDLPPGTGDAQLSITQLLSLSGAVIVTTPQDVALADARKGLAMFGKVNVPVLGIVENMAFFCCPNCGHESAIFGSDGGRRLAEKSGVPLLGRIPLETSVREGGDAGTPVTIADPEGPVARAFQEAAERLAQRVSIVNLAAESAETLPS